MRRTPRRQPGLLAASRPRAARHGPNDGGSETGAASRRICVQGSAARAGWEPGPGVDDVPSLRPTGAVVLDRRRSIRNEGYAAWNGNSRKPHDASYQWFTSYSHGSHGGRAQMIRPRQLGIGNFAQATRTRCNAACVVPATRQIE